MKSEIVQTNGDLSDGHIKSMLRRWFIETEGTVKVRQLKKKKKHLNPTHNYKQKPSYKKKKFSNLRLETETINYNGAVPVFMMHVIFVIRHS